MSSINQNNSWRPSYPIHPGETLLETLESLDMSQKELSERTGLVPKTINEIVRGKNPITPETAIKLSMVFGNSVEFWNNLQRNYDENLAILAKQKKLEEEVVYFKKFTCYGELEKWGFVVKDVEDTIESKIQKLLEFLGVSSLHFLTNVYKVAFHSTPHENKTESKENLVAWLRCGEVEAKKIMEADKITVKKFNRQELIDSLNFLRSLTNIGEPEKFQQRLIEKCASFGVIVVFVPYFSNTYICGATRWLNSDTALVQLSLRGKRADGFWFTFYHELGHILLHGKKEEFVDYEGSLQENISEEALTKELEANKFAKDTLIPELEYQKFMAQKPLNDVKVINFAKKIGVHPGIVAGRVAYELKDRQNIWPKIEKLTIRYSFKKEDA